MSAVRRQDVRSEQRQLNQVADSAEQPDIERHRENRSEPTLHGFAGQDDRSLGKITVQDYSTLKRPDCKEIPEEDQPARSPFSRTSSTSTCMSSGSRADSARCAIMLIACTGPRPFW